MNEEEKARENLANTKQGKHLAKVRHRFTEEDRKKSASKRHKSSKREIEEIRRIFAKMADSVQPRIHKFLMDTAEGVPQRDEGGNVIRDERGAVVWSNAPDPARAVDIFLKISKFVIPELKAVSVEALVRDESGTQITLPPWMIKEAIEDDEPEP